MASYKDQKVIFISDAQTFDVTVKGLLPKTVHYPYFELKRIESSSIKPEGGELGDPITTDENGQVTFKYYYDAGLPTQATSYEYFQELRNSVAGTKKLVLTNINTEELDSSYTTTSLSYAESKIKIEIYNATADEFRTGFDVQ